MIRLKEIQNLRGLKIIKYFLRSEKSRVPVDRYLLKAFQDLQYEIFFEDLLKHYNWYLNTFFIKIRPVVRKKEFLQGPENFKSKIGGKWAIILWKYHFRESTTLLENTLMSHSESITEYRVPGYSDFWANFRAIEYSSNKVEHSSICFYLVITYIFGNIQY